MSPLRRACPFPSFFASLAAALVLLFSGCATAPTTAPSHPATPTTAAESRPRQAAESDAIPVPGQRSVPATVSAPAAPAESKPATIVGFEESSTMFDNLTVFVTSVDGHRLSAGRTGWNTPISIKPGPHVIGAEFNRGVFAAKAELKLEAKPGTAYQVKFATDAQLFGKNSFCEFWIEELGNGEKALPPVRVSLMRVEGQNGRH